MSVCRSSRMDFRREKDFRMRGARTAWASTQEKCGWPPRALFCGEAGHGVGTADDDKNPW